MMNEELLKAAAKEVSLCRLDCLDAMEPEHHTFSPKFERRMKRLIHKTDHPYRYIVRNVAAIFIAMIMLFAALLAINPKARAMFTKWLCNITGGVVYYQYVGETEIQKLPEYVLGQVPEGYTLYKTQNYRDGCEYVYHGLDGKVLTFWYTSGVVNADLYIVNQNYKCSKVSFKGTIAEVYMSPCGYECSKIVWTDSDEEILFVVSYHGDQEKLLEVAQTVRMK